MFRIDDALKEFIEGGVAVVLGTASQDRRPHVTYVWGPKVVDSREGLQVFLERARLAQPEANLENTTVAAVTMADPITYRSIQLKGRYLASTPATEEEEAWVQRHRQAFASATALVGDPPGVRRNVWMDDRLVRLEFKVETAFDQTPGPNAGQPL
jgi:hypothetical protein